MGDGLLNQLGQMIHHPGKGPGDKTGFHGHGNRDRIKRGSGHSGRLSLGDESGFRSGAGLALGETVHLVVVHQEGDIDVPPDGGQEMVASFPVVAAVSAFHDHRHCGIGQLGPRSRGKRPSVESVEEIHVQVMRCLGRLPDSGYEYDICDGGSWLDTKACFTAFKIEWLPQPGHQAVS